jgi:hypothetical protein
MARRCLLIVLALLVAATPVALNLCQTFCASATTAHATAGLKARANTTTAHSCHEDAQAPVSVVAPVSHPCGHGHEPARSIAAISGLDTVPPTEPAVEHKSVGRPPSIFVSRVTSDQRLLPPIDPVQNVPLRI